MALLHYLQIYMILCLYFLNTTYFTYILKKQHRTATVNIKSGSYLSQFLSYTCYVENNPAASFTTREN